MLFRILFWLVQDGWCDSVGSVEDIQAKLLKRQEAAAKRERAMAYALSHQVHYFLQVRVITCFRDNGYLFVNKRELIASEQST